MPHRTKKYIAFDLGAESARIVCGFFDGNRLRLEEIYRFQTGYTVIFNSFYWNILRLYDELKNGLRLFARKYGSQLSGIGVDTCGVDFGLLDKTGKLLSNPYHYRDHRTDGVMPKVFEKISREKIYSITGIQFMQINSIYQLYSMVLENPKIFSIADKLLMLPDIFNYFLTGNPTTEYTNATTTQLLDAKQHTWSNYILEMLSIPQSIFPAIVQPGTIIGELTSAVKEETGIDSCPVIAPACHDTASAVVAVPVKANNWAYLSSGTWSLLGLEIDAPIINETTMSHNITNEGGVNGTIRLLKNIVGLWLIQECKRIWEKEGDILSYEEMMQLAEKSKPFIASFDPSKEQFLNPEDMASAIVDAVYHQSGKKLISKGEIVRTIMECLAFKYREVLDTFQNIIGRPIEVLHIIGGGAKNRTLNQFTANATGKIVIAGPSEATAIGNIIMQLIATGELSSLAEAREMVHRSFESEIYQPLEKDIWNEHYEARKNNK